MYSSLDNDDDWQNNSSKSGSEDEEEEEPDLETLSAAIKMEVSNTYYSN